MQKIVTINAELITSWDSFHSLFKKTFGYPDFYGNNMNAWIDCMSYIDDKDSGMTSIWISQNDIIVIELTNSESFKERCFEIYLALMECSALVNARKIKQSGEGIIAIALS